VSTGSLFSQPPQLSCQHATDNSDVADSNCRIDIERLEFPAKDMNRSLAVLRWIPALLSVWFFSFVVTAASARQSDSELTPGVQQLYEQAKSAQERGDIGTAIGKYRAIVTLAPHLASAYNNLGMLYLKRREYTDAADVLKRALELDPKMRSASGMLGMSYFQLGLNDKAEPLLREALSFQPTDDNLEMTLALVLINLKKYGEAASHLNTLLNRNPKNLEAWYSLRRTYLELAEDARGKIDQIDSDSVVAHEIAGEIAEGMLDFTGASVEYRKAIDKAPNQPGTHMSLGNVYWRIGKWEAAQTEFKAELTNNPNNCYARWKLADAVLESDGSSEDALEELNQSINRCPALMEARVDRARALIRMGKHSDALPDLLMAEKEKPSEPTIHFLLGSVYRAQGKAAEAEQEMHTFEQLKSRSTAEQR
jgi:tetratricopeptide (TPR) repeat protein